VVLVQVSDGGDCEAQQFFLQRSLRLIVDHDAALQREKSGSTDVDLVAFCLESQRERERERENTG
jgi:hypothetical protein